MSKTIPNKRPTPTSEEVQSWLDEWEELSTGNSHVSLDFEVPPDEEADIQGDAGHTPPVAATQPADQPVQPAPTKENSVISERLTARLAMELAANLLTREEIAEQFDLTIPQLKAIIVAPAFRAIYRDALATWGGGLNAEERAQKKADMVVEDGLAKMVGIIQGAASSPGHAIDAFKSVVSVSSHAPKNKQAKDGGPQGERFVLNISLANGAEPITIETETPARPADPDPDAPAIIDGTT